MVAIYWRFIDRSGADVTGLPVVDGTLLRDFFSQRLEDVYALRSVKIAHRLLEVSYQGVDSAGVGVRWRIEPVE